MNGLDLLGAAKYSSVAVKSFPKGWAVGVFSNTFGDARPFIRKLLATGKCPRVRVQLAWKDLHNFSRKDFPTIIKEAKKWIPLMHEFDRVEWYFSGACEHKMSSADALSLAQKVLDVLPALDPVYVNCPMKGGGMIHGSRFINEVHGTHASKPNGAYNFSFDGEACVDSDIEAAKKKYSNAETFFYWDARCNGKYESKDTTPRPQRAGWPDRRLIESWVNLANDRGDCSLPRGWLWKSHAENHGAGDLKAEKPVLIAKIKVKAFELHQLNKPVATLNYYGTYEGGGYRYYAKVLGYQISKEPALLVADGKIYGKVNPGFRFGSFR